MRNPLRIFACVLLAVLALLLVANAAPAGDRLLVQQVNNHRGANLNIRVVPTGTVQTQLLVRGHGRLNQINTFVSTPYNGNANIVFRQSQNYGYAPVQTIVFPQRVIQPIYYQQIYQPPAQLIQPELAPVMPPADQGCYNSGVNYLQTPQYVTGGCGSTISYLQTPAYVTGGCGVGSINYLRAAQSIYYRPSAQVVFRSGNFLRVR